MAHHHLHRRLERREMTSRIFTQTIMMKMEEKQKPILTKIPTATIINTTVGAGKHLNRIQKTEVVMEKQKKVKRQKKIITFYGKLLV